jgi:predicted Na+-dependent transporter
MTGGPLLKTVVDAGVPVLVFFAMVVVGMELTAGDFRRVARQPGTVVAATVGQFVSLPIIGWLLVRCLGLQPAIARGVLLVAACPSGAMANVYTSLARANVALSVTLTAVSGLAAVLTTPLALAVLQAQVGESTGFPVRYQSFSRRSLCSDACGSVTETTPQELTTHEPPRFTNRESDNRTG